ncbi:hypothetical protein OPIT5_09370 [Opitutaceae bacterium TAV5]|nr:hypothetical protein OPIT5_09370 [Opitutaceae bacterium TAV5]
MITSGPVTSAPPPAPALETAKLTRNETFLARACAACSRQDAWLRALSNRAAT